MIIAVNFQNRSSHRSLIDGMFRDRKRIFVDLLKWDVPIVGDWECDQFDDNDAEYIIIADPTTGSHLASMRLLRTDRPHILGDLFPSLCEGDRPSSPHIRELTRLCLSPDLRARDRRKIRNRLFTTLVEYALASGITGYVGVAYMQWYVQLLALGWRCAPLGLPQDINGERLAAAVAYIETDTLDRFRDAGTYESADSFTMSTLRRAA